MITKTIILTALERISQDYKQRHTREINLMKIVTMNEIEPAKRSDVMMRTFFGRDVDENTNVTMGTIMFPPGARVPAEGTGVHAEHEYSYVISGSILTMSGGKEYRLSNGQASYIPSGEAHWALNDGTENCEIVWVMVNKG